MDKNKILLGIMTVVVGILVVLSPDAIIKFIVIVLGAEAMVNGLFILLVGRNVLPDTGYRRAVIVRGVLGLVCGACAVSFPFLLIETFGKIWSFTAFMLAAFLVVSAVIQIFTTVKLKRNGVMIKAQVVEIVSSVLIAAIFCLIPIETIGSALIRAIGVVIVLIGLALLLLQYRTRAISLVPDSVETIEEKPDSEARPE